MERVAVIASGGNQLCSPKLLGIPCAPNATGKAQKDSVIGLLTTWQVLNVSIGLVFDTTASNTGVRNGCASLLEEELNKALLWLACRHHIAELRVRAVWDAVYGAANSPIEPLLRRFQEEWESLDRSTENLVLFDHSNASSFMCRK